MTRTRFTTPLVLLAIALGYAVVSGGGDADFDSSVTLLIVATAAVSAVLLWGNDSSIWALDRLDALALALPAYVAFQLIPLPLALLRVISPSRAAMADALQGITDAQSFTPITISSPTTWGYLLRVLGYALVFVVIRQIARQSTHRIWTPVIPLMVVGLLETGWALAIESANPQQFSGTFFSRNHFAGLLEMILPFVVMYGLTLLYRGRQRDGLSTAAAVSGSCVLASAVAVFLAITASLSKGGVLSTLLSLLTMALLSIEGRLSGLKRWSVVAALGVFALLTLVFLTPTELVKRFESFVSDDVTEGRFPILKDTRHLIAAFPVVGVGLGNFYPAVMPFQSYGFNLAWVHAHNDYLQLLSELGIVGWLIPAALITQIIMRASRAAILGSTSEVRALGLACMGGLTAILVHSFGDFNTYVLSNALLLAWIVALSATIAGPIGRTNLEPRRQPATFIRWAVLGLGVFLSVYAGAWLLFLQRYSNNAGAERIFCRFGICNSEAAIAALLDRQAATGQTTLSPEHFTPFVLREPAASYRWDQLGEALQKAGRSADARYCFSRALALGPNSPPTLLMAADFHFDVGEQQEALTLVSRILKLGGSDRAIFNVLDYRKMPAADIVRYALPDQRSLQAYLTRLIEDGRVTDAELTWALMVSRGYIDDAQASRYVNFLLTSKKPDAAARDWTSYASGRSEGYPHLNRIFNGDFEQDPTGSAFDWRLDKLGGISIAFDRDIRHSGTRSLRIAFDGATNPADLGVLERVFLPPGQYRFRAFVRTQDVSTDQGIGFRVVYDEASQQLDWFSERLRGTNDWTLVEGRLDGPVRGGMVSVRLVRRPSLKFDNLLRGTAWVDAVALSEVAQ